MRKFPLYFFIILIAGSSFGYGQVPVRKKINIDENWKFHFGNAADPAKDFNYSIATIFSKSGGAAGTAIDARFNDSSWKMLNLPHDWAVELPDGKGKGSCIWEPLSTWESIFDKDGKSNDFIKMYDAMSKKYITGN